MNTHHALFTTHMSFLWKSHIWNTDASQGGIYSDGRFSHLSLLEVPFFHIQDIQNLINSIAPGNRIVRLGQLKPASSLARALVGYEKSSCCIGLHSSCFISFSFAVCAFLNISRNGRGLCYGGLNPWRVETPLFLKEIKQCLPVTSTYSISSILPISLPFLFSFLPSSFLFLNS